MTKEFNFLFHTALDAMVSGGISEADAEELLGRLVAEGSCFVSTMDAEDFDSGDMSDREQELCLEMIRVLSSGGTNYGHAILLTASLMAAVERRILNNIGF